MVTTLNLGYEVTLGKYFMLIILHRYNAKVVPHDLIWSYKVLMSPNVKKMVCIHVEPSISTHPMYNTCPIPMLHSSLTIILSKLSFTREPIITKVKLHHRNPTQATISVMVFLK